MVFDLKAELHRRNKKYRVQGLGLYLEERNGRLVIRGTLPPRPDSDATRPYRQRLDLGLPCTKVGVMEAEKVLKRLGDQLKQKTFSWQSWTQEHPQAQRNRSKGVLTVREAVTKVEQEYFKTRDRKDRKKLHSWKSNYLLIYKQLPQDEPLHPDLLRNLIMDKRPGTLHRNKTLYVCRYLAKINNMSLYTEDIATSIERRTAQFRRPPSDQDVVKIWGRIKEEINQKRRDLKYWHTVIWTYGMMATYGLRPHEVLHIEWNSDNTINVIKHKTDHLYGARENVYPFHKDWVDLFQLRDGGVLVPINEKNLRPGGRFVPQIANAFRTLEIGFRPYDLRHAYALRLMRFHVDFSISASMMGHTVDVHMNTYRKWINDELKHEQLQMAYQEAQKTPSHQDQGGGEN